MTDKSDAGARARPVLAANDDAPPRRRVRGGQPTAVQRRWLALGLDQPGGKLPLFYDDGREVNRKTVETCVRKGWAEPWIANPIEPDWLVCRLTEAGRATVSKGTN